ncbi:MAG: 3-isopropylmalate dehydrogenase [Alphaproteobacteria bacterium]|nr:3-isopropylmalate dehydrogenase [Alphaproteobacteria bacterium]
MSKRDLLVLAGDGIGPEVMAEACRVAEWFIGKGRIEATLTASPFGVSAWRDSGELMPASTLQRVREADAILFGANGGPEYDAIPHALRRAGSLLRIRKELDLYANIRPVRHWPELAASCPLKDEVAGGTDLVVVRENTSGLYFGEPRGIETLADGRKRGVNTQSYSSDEIERIARVAFTLAGTRQGRVCSVDKSNVMESGALWREVVHRVHREEFPRIELSDMLADNCAMQLVRAPRQFDVILTDNMFGDLLSDCAGSISGSLGMLPSASLGARRADGRLPALYEPVHGSAPDIAGQGVANPLAAVLSFAMCLQYTFGAPGEADLLLRAVRQALADGARTPDLAASGSRRVGTRQMGDAVLAALGSLA